MAEAPGLVVGAQRARPAVLPHQAGQRVERERRAAVGVGAARAEGQQRIYTINVSVVEEALVLLARLIKPGDKDR